MGCRNMQNQKTLKISRKEILKYQIKNQIKRFFVEIIFKRIIPTLLFLTLMLYLYSWDKHITMEAGFLKLWDELFHPIIKCLYNVFLKDLIKNGGFK